MKKNILLSLLMLLSISLISQEKGSYLSLSTGIGRAGYKYEMGAIDFADTKRDILFGGQVNFGYSYYFTNNVGISTGLGFSHYRTKAHLKGEFQPEKYFVLNTYTDNDPFDGHVTTYDLRVRTQNWTEYQSGKYLEIPVILNLQKKFGENEIFGVYLAAGFKFQIPLTSKYAIVDGDRVEQAKLSISGYYPERNLELGELSSPDLAQHGFGKIHNPSQVLKNATGKLNFGFNISAVAEAGFLISFSKRVDLTLGAFIDGGLLNINKKETSTAMFTGPDADYVAGGEYNIAKGISYSSMVKSEYVNKVKTISYGGKVGLRIKLGKLSEKQEQQPQQQPQIVCPPCEKDTVYIHQTEPIALDSLLKEVIDALKERPKFNMPETHNNYHLDSYIPDNMPTKEVDYLFDPIYFDLNKSVLRPESTRNLDKKADIMKKNPQMRLLISGNTCDLGNDNLNYDLGLKRAEAARNYLIRKGIGAERLEITTLSRFEPEMPNNNELNRTHNRRADFKPVFLK